MAAQHQPQMFHLHRRGRDQRGRAHCPGVDQPGPHRVGPVEGAGMQQPVGRLQPLPALMHRRPRQHCPVGVAHRQGRARGARGEDDIALAPRIPQMPVARRRRLPGGQVGGKDGQALRQGDPVVGQHHAGAYGRGHPRGLGGRQQRRGRDRHHPRRHGPQPSHRPGRGIAHAHQDALAGAQALRPQPAAAALHRADQAGIAPPFRPRQRQYGQRHLVRRGRPRAKHMPGQVEGRQVQVGGRALGGRLSGGMRLRHHGCGGRSSRLSSPARACKSRHARFRRLSRRDDAAGGGRRPAR